MKQIEILNLSSGYNDRAIIHNVTLSVNKGEFLSIIGPNGSGKSTLLKTLTGYLPTLLGEILIDGVSLSDMKVSKRAQSIAVVNQRVEEIDISVFDFVMLGRFPYRKQWQFFDSGADRDIVIEVLGRIGMTHKAESKMKELSGGEQQLVAIARALAQDTRILLLDEPTSNLDIAHQMKVLNLLQELNKKKGLTIVIVLHDLNLASEFSDKLVLLNQGRIVSSGVPEEVLKFDVLEKIYNTVLLTQPHPLTNRPAVFVVSQMTLETYKENQ